MFNLTSSSTFFVYIDIVIHFLTNTRLVFLFLFEIRIFDPCWMRIDICCVCYKALFPWINTESLLDLLFELSLQLNCNMIQMYNRQVWDKFFSSICDVCFSFQNQKCISWWKESAGDVWRVHISLYIFMFIYRYNIYTYIHTSVCHLSLNTHILTYRLSEKLYFDQRALIATYWNTTE